MKQLETKTQIKKIMERETALKIIDEIKNNICDVDLDSLCKEKVEVKPDASSKKDHIFEKTVQAVMCGLVYWDEKNHYLTQKLISPLKAGELSAETLYYKNKLTLSDAKNFNAENSADLTIQSLSVVCARPSHLIGKIQGQDLNIAMGCLSFLDK